MNNKGFLTIIASILILIVGFAGLIGYEKTLEKKFGTTIPQVIALFETTLASKISSSATSMTLTSGVDKAGNALNAYICFALDEGTASEEFICGTASSTAVSTLLRGLDPITTATSTALAKEHRRGASVKITDYPQLAILSRILNGNETIPNMLTYSSALSFTSGSNQLASVTYVDTTATSGAALAGTAVAGLVEIATKSELNISTATGSTGAILIVPNSAFSTSSSATTTVVVTGETGKISTGFIDQTGNYTWSGNNTFSGTNSFSSTSTFIGPVTISGTTTMTTTTFDTIPTLPASNPTTDNQAARKAYVDTFQKFTTSTTTSKTIGTYYLNSSVWKIVTISVQMMVDAGTEYCTFSGQIGVATSTMTTMNQIAEISGGAVFPSSTFYQNMTIIVPPNYYYYATSTQSGTVTCALLTWSEAY